MRQTLFLKLNFLILMTFIFFISCKKDRCNCDCDETLYIGGDCNNPNISFIQELLTSGETPQNLLENGVPIDSFYGKIYQDGFIFHLNSDGTGMVAALEDQNDGEGMSWGCSFFDITALENVLEYSTSSTDPSEIIGARIGDGAENTNHIVNECMENETPAKLCRELGSEWFLPSLGEIILMHSNLHLNGHGNFKNKWYWSSTEHGENTAWGKGFDSGNGLVYYQKSYDDQIRAAKGF